MRPLPLTREDALFLDFDGTLAPLQDDADAVSLMPRQLDTLHNLHHALDGAICLISGRDLDDLKVRSPDGLVRVGNHGLRREGVPGGRHAERPKNLTDGMQGLADAHNGVRLERKGAVLALHYRDAPSRGEALDKEVRALTDAEDGYKTEHGKFVIEAKPVAASKGRALAEIMARPPFHGRRPVMLGDDTTDEPAFACAQALGGFGVKVGNGASRARYRLDAPSDVFAFLDALLDSPAS